MKLSSQQELALYWIAQPHNSVTWANTSYRSSMIFMCTQRDERGFRARQWEINSRTVNALITKGLVEHAGHTHRIRATVNGRVYLQNNR